MTTNPNSFAYDADNERLICEVCVEWVAFSDLYVDGDGVKWDVCQKCGEQGNV